MNYSESIKRKHQLEMGYYEISVDTVYFVFVVKCLLIMYTVFNIRSLGIMAGNVNCIVFD